MATPLFDLYFSGKTIAGEDPALVRARVGKLFSADEATLERLFSGKPIRIKSGVDQERAIHYRVSLRDAGALLEIRPQQSSGTTAASAPSGASEPRLLPPNTGTLADCAPRIEAAPIPDISGIDLSPPGSTIDTSEPAPPASIATADFTLGEPNSGTLEDCQPEVTPTPIPDISHLKITGA